MIHGDQSINALLGKFHHDLNQRPKPIDDGECKGHDRKIQVSELS